MAIVNHIQNSFSGGELDPKLLGRTDLEKYKTGLSTLYNFLVSPLGYVYRRPGTKYIGSVKTPAAKSRLIDFEYSNEQAYVLEFVNLGLRFYKDQGQILQGRDLNNGSFTSGVSGWTSRIAGTGAVSYDSGNQRLTLTGDSTGNEARAYQSIENLGVSTYVLSVDVFTANTRLRIGSSVGDSDILNQVLAPGTSQAVEFTPLTNGTTYFEFECLATSSVDNISLNSPIYELNTDFTQAELEDIRFTQSFDTLYLCHENHPPKQLQRLGHDNWVLSDITFTEPAYLDINTTETTIAVSSSALGTTTISASAPIFASTDIGRAIRYRSGPDKSKTVNYIGTAAKTYYDIPFFPQGVNDVVVNFIESTGVRTLKTYTSSAAPAAGEYTIIAGQVLTGDVATTAQYVELSQPYAGSGEWGWILITQFNNTSQVGGIVQRELGGVNTSTFWQLGAWSATTGYPKVCTLHEQRLWFANTTSQPQTIWGSQVGIYTNFQPDNILFKGDVDPDTSVTFTIAASKSQAINWIISKTALLIGTTNGIFSARGASSGLSNSNVTLKKEADISCEFIAPAETFNEVLFVEKLGKKIHSVYYQFNIDGYQVDEISLVSQHIGEESPFISIQFQNTTRILWCRRADGSLATCTYSRLQEAMSWAVQELGGSQVEVESLTSIPGAVHEEIWMVVKRVINSQTVRYIELLDKEFSGDTKQEAMFLDSALIYSGASATTITGLTHLEDQTVSILSNGSVHRDLVVSGGSITLDLATTYAAIGLSKQAILETLTIEAGSKIGTAQGSISRITEIGMKFFKTLGGKFGYDGDNLDPILFRKTYDTMNSSPNLITDMEILRFRGGFHRGYKVYIKQDQPLPLTLLSIIFKAQVSDAQ